MKALMSLLLLFTLNVGAQTHIDLGQPAHCSPHTKNPLCWEQPIEPDPRSHNFKLCADLTLTSNIIAVYEDVRVPRPAQTIFKCISKEQKLFDCSKIVDLYGTNIIDEEVKITIKHFRISHPGCHIIGGCQRCVESSIYGELIK